MIVELNSTIVAHLHRKQEIQDSSLNPGKKCSLEILVEKTI